MKIGFDIGGVISRYPTEMISMMAAFDEAGCEVYVVTDMNQVDAQAACDQNGLSHLVPRARIISCDWSKHGDMCKAEAIKDLGIDIMFDDRLDYIYEGARIAFMLVPRPRTPYYHKDWINKSTPAVCVPPEEYEEFKRWKSERNQ